MNYRRTSRDSNHHEVIRHGEKHGVDVIDLSAAGTLPDTLCKYKGFIAFAEIKPEGGRTTYQRAQLKFISETTFPVAIVKTGEQLMTFMATGEGLTQRQKDAIAVFLMREPASKKKWHPQLIEKVLAPLPTAGDKCK